MWNDLSMAERAKIIELGVQSGITNLNDIKSSYDRVIKESYKDWKNKIEEYKGIDVDNDSTYDYRNFYNEDPNRAYRMLKDDPEAHFTDRYKKPSHPTFSDESIYSNSNTPGGHWYNIDDKYIYEPSEYTGTPERNAKRREYMMNTGEGYAVGNKVYFPNDERGITLPELEVIGNKFDTGGSMKGRATTPEQARMYPYYDEDYDMSYSTMPEGKTYRSTRPTTAPLFKGEYDDFIVTPKGVSQDIPTVYSRDTEQNLKHRSNVEEVDALVQNTALTLPGMIQIAGANFLSPTQLARGIYDQYKGNDNFFNSVYFGNSGIVPNKFAEKHPYITAGINTLADIAAGDILFTGATKAPLSIREAKNNFRYNRGIRSLSKQMDRATDIGLDTETRYLNKHNSYISTPRFEINSSYASGRPDLFGENWYHSTSSNRITGSQRGLYSGRKFVSYGEPWKETMGDILHELPDNALDIKYSTDFAGVPTEWGIRDIGKAYINRRLGFTDSYDDIIERMSRKKVTEVPSNSFKSELPVDLYYGNQTTLDADVLNKAIVETPHNIYRRFGKEFGEGYRGPWFKTLHVGSVSSDPLPYLTIKSRGIK